MIDPKRVIEWNEKAGNLNWVVNYWLEIDMLKEELSETEQAIKNNDTIEVVDWIIDLIFVGIWTLHKMWLSADDISWAFNEVCDSNDSKFPFKKDENWKVKKNPNFKRPDLSKIIRQ